MKHIQINLQYLDLSHYQVQIHGRIQEKYGITKLSEDWEQYFNIAGQYEGGMTFETKDMDKKELKRLHDMLVGSLLKRGQNGKMENYYSKLKIK